MTGPEIDIVLRLRNLANLIRLIARTEDRNTCDDAADEIERMARELEELDFLRHEGGPQSVAAMEAALRALVDRDASYHGSEIRIHADSHGDAIRRMTDARRALTGLGE